MYGSERQGLAPRQHLARHLKDYRGANQLATLVPIAFSAGREAGFGRNRGASVSVGVGVGVGGGVQEVPRNRSYSTGLWSSPVTRSFS